MQEMSSGENDLEGSAGEVYLKLTPGMSSGEMSSQECPSMKCASGENVRGKVSGEKGRNIEKNYGDWGIQEVELFRKVANDNPLTREELILLNSEIVFHRGKQIAYPSEVMKNIKKLIRRIKGGTSVFQ